MSIIEKIARWWGSDRSATAALVDNILSDPRQQNVDQVLALVADNQPGTNDRSYRQEIYRRKALYDNNQQAIMAEIAKKRYPESEGNQAEQVNLPVLRGFVNDQAKVLSAPGEFDLLDDAGDPIEDEGILERFNKVLEDARVTTAMRAIDITTYRDDAGIWRNWWDPEAKCARASVWSPYLVHAVANPWLRWSADACPAVLFEMPGIDGVNSATKRYEVLAKKLIPNESGEGGTWRTLHYYVYTDSENGWHDEAINEEYALPFVDPDTSDPIYPFTWWRKEDATELYPLTNEDMTTPNITANCVMTDMMQHIKYKSGGLFFATQTGGGGDTGAFPAKLAAGPKKIPTLPAGWDLKAINLDMGITEVAEVMHGVLQLTAKLQGQNPNAMRADSGAAESAYKLKIERLPMEENRAAQIPTYKPLLEDSVRRLLIVSDTHCEPGDKVGHYNVRWTPGKLSIPTDEEAEARVDALLMTKNIITPVDVVMRRDGVDRETATQTVKDNAALNKELMSEGIAGSLLESRTGFAPTDDEPEGKDAAVRDDNTKQIADHIQTKMDDGTLTADPEKVNVYHIAKAIEAGAASAVDLRMFLFGESEQEARTALTRVSSDNQAIADVLGKAKAIEDKASGEDKKRDES